ncbi:hypothetical protein [Clostridium tyrobutyricum]|uniref:hypothetical protein n=1 Tax=Clostridium tyrobutyricum TaxID=1519 RepID=UPI001C388EF3|nr:hypothetical protein [Clostridium tyrobutyricum]MBV4417183.1 hypothetical protein [Clostridium tyrobutyricum]
MHFTCYGCKHVPYKREYPCTSCGKYILSEDGESTFYIRTNWEYEKVSCKNQSSIKKKGESIMGNNNFQDMFNDPKFEVDAEKYISRYKNLIKAMDKYMKDLQVRIDKADIGESFMLLAEKITLDYQKEFVNQTINSLNFYNH